MKVLVCGGRDYSDRSVVVRYLAQLAPTLVIQGGATGADRLAVDWCISHGVQYASVPALWTSDGKSAGPKRNQSMLQLLPHVVLAFPGGRGTADMVRRARASGTRVIEIAPTPATDP